MRSCSVIAIINSNNKITNIDMKKYIVEGLGTFALTLVIALSVASRFPISASVLASLVLGLFVYFFGNISGSHLNPAVTLGLWSTKKIDAEETFKYIGAQFAGAICAFLIASFVSQVGAEAHVFVKDIFRVGFAEFVGAVFLSFGFASVSSGNVQKNLSGLVIGGALFIGMTFAEMLGSNGLVNPAVAFGIKSFGIMYLFGPIAGGILGMKLYDKLQS